MQRGTKIEYTYAAGAVVRGIVSRLYNDRDVAAHRRSHGDKAAEKLQEWVVCKLTDAQGTYSGACHLSQLRVVA